MEMHLHLAHHLHGVGQEDLTRKHPVAQKGSIFSRYMYGMHPRDSGRRHNHKIAPGTSEKVQSFRDKIQIHLRRTGRRHDYEIVPGALEKVRYFRDKIQIHLRRTDRRHNYEIAPGTSEKFRFFEIRFRSISVGPIGDMPTRSHIMPQKRIDFSRYGSDPSSWDRAAMCTRE